MNCAEVQELLSAYHDGELDDHQRPRLAAHLDECSDCATELAGFERLSILATSQSASAPPDHIWTQLERQLDQQPGGRQQVVKAAPPVRWSASRLQFVALAATVLAAIGVGWLSYRTWYSGGEQDQFTVEFGEYLDEFRRDPDAAQQILLAKYSNQPVGPAQAIAEVGYRPAIADGLPAGYAVTSTHIMEMPCCTCVQSVCRRSDGSTLAVFEHDDERCGDRHCCLIDLEDQIAASWQRGERHITLIGVRDTGEVSRMVTWLGKTEQPLPN